MQLADGAVQDAGHGRRMKPRTHIPETTIAALASVRSLVSTTVLGFDCLASERSVFRDLQTARPVDRDPVSVQSSMNELHVQMSFEARTLVTHKV